MPYTTVPTVVDGDPLTDDFTLAVKDAVDELQKLRSGIDFSAASTGPTSGTTRLVINTISVPDLGVGTLHAWAQVLYSKTVGTDVFDFDVNVSSTTWRSRGFVSSTSALSYSVCGAWSITGAVSLTTGLTRTAGTGTATITEAGFTFTKWLFVPAP